MRVGIVIAAERGTDATLFEGHQHLDDLNLSVAEPSDSANAWSAFISDWRWHMKSTKAFAMASTACDVHRDVANWTDSVWVAAYGIEAIADAMVTGARNTTWLEGSYHQAKATWPPSIVPRHSGASMLSQKS